MRDSDRFTHLKHGITKPIYFGDKIDYIFHLASPASPIDYLDLPIQTLTVGAPGTYNMLGLAKELNARLQVDDVGFCGACECLVSILHGI